MTSNVDLTPPELVYNAATNSTHGSCGFMKELSDSLKLAVAERTSSPFFGIFLFVWLGFNWRAVSIFILSEKDVFLRIQHINEHYINAADNFWLPLLFTALTVLLYPLVTYYPFMLWQHLKRKKEEVVELYDNQKRITPETYQALKIQLRQQREDMHEIIAEHDNAKQAALKELEKVRERSIEETKEANEKLKVSQEKLTSTQHSISEKELELQELRAKLEHQVKALEQSMSKIAESDDHRLKLTETISYMEKKIEEQKKKRESLSKQIKERDDTIDKLKAEFVSSKSELDGVRGVFSPHFPFSQPIDTSLGQATSTAGNLEKLFFTPNENDATKLPNSLRSFQVEDSALSGSKNRPTFITGTGHRLNTSDKKPHKDR